MTSCIPRIPIKEFIIMQCFLRPTRGPKHSGGKKISTGINNTFPYKYIPSTHAEIEAMIRAQRWIARKKHKKIKLNLIVLRYSISGKLGESRPCYHCLKELQASNLNIKNVYYSDINGAIKKEKFSHMIITLQNAFVTSGSKLR